jgi:hypothetical protein
VINSFFVEFASPNGKHTSPLPAVVAFELVYGTVNYKQNSCFPDERAAVPLGWNTITFEGARRSGKTASGIRFPGGYPMFAVGLCLMPGAEPGKVTG